MTYTELLKQYITALRERITRDSASVDVLNAKLIGVLERGTSNTDSPKLPTLSTPVTASAPSKVTRLVKRTLQTAKR